MNKSRSYEDKRNESPLVFGWAISATTVLAAGSLLRVLECHGMSMYPEVMWDSPGNCPKCGMKLVAKK